MKINLVSLARIKHFLYHIIMIDFYFLYYYFLPLIIPLFYFSMLFFMDSSRLLQS